MPTDVLLDVRQVGDMLSLGRSTIYRLVDAGKIPCAVRIGRTRRWRRTELERWIEMGCPPVNVFEERCR